MNIITIKRLNDDNTITEIRVDVDELQEFLDDHELKIKVIVYRQGAHKPELVEFEGVMPNE